METTRKILLYVLIVTLVLTAGSLAGWYFFLHSKTASTTAIDTARGLNANLPTFSGNLGSTAANTQAVSANTNTGNSGSALRLWQADPQPVAGMAFDTASSSSASSTDLYFVERATGYVFVADASAQTAHRLTDTLMPKIYEAVFAPSQSAVLLRYIDSSGNVATFAADYASTTAATSSPLTLTGRYMQDNIRSIIVDQKTAALSYLVPSSDSYGAELWTEQWNESKQKQVFSSPMADWQLQMVDGQLLFVESPADDTPGYAYTFANGALTPFLGPILGLEILGDPDENALLYSSSANATLSLFAQVGKNAAVALPLQTIAEKCVWAPGRSLIAYCAVPAATGSEHFLDDWFQGDIHTTDTWWEIDASAGTASILYTMPSSLDVQHPTIDPSGNYIAFQNGSDQSLWILRIAQ